MAILDLYSNRRKREMGDGPDVFVYDNIPETLRVQIGHIIHDAIGEWFNQWGRPSPAGKNYELIVELLIREFGRLKLAKGERADAEILNFILTERDVNKCLDGIEVSFRLIQMTGEDRNYPDACQCKLDAKGAISDLNHRFLEHGVGYQYVSGEIIRVDSQYLHAEVIKPALALLQDKRYKGANEEFWKAHEHSRTGEVKDCLTNSLKALESTLKTICTIRKWPFQPTDTAKPLLDVCFANGLFPAYLQSHYSSLRSMLESGVPTVRNKTSGHGQGPAVVTVPPHFAAYALHMTGSAIQFLIEAEKDLPTIP